MKVGDIVIRTGLDYPPVKKGGIYKITKIYDYGIDDMVGLRLKNTPGEYDIKYFKKIDLFMKLKII